MTWSRIHSAPLRVLPKPRPASSSQVRQSPFGACLLGRPHQPQSCSIASSSRSLVCFRNAASCCGGSDASNSAHETFSDSANLDLDRITVRHTGVFVGKPAPVAMDEDDLPDRGGGQQGSAPSIRRLLADNGSPGGGESPPPPPSTPRPPDP